jgi:hypothetical protein
MLIGTRAPSPAKRSRMAAGCVDLLLEEAGYGRGRSRPAVTVVGHGHWSSCPQYIVGRLRRADHLDAGGGADHPRAGRAALPRRTGAGRGLGGGGGTVGPVGRTDRRRGLVGCSGGEATPGPGCSGGERASPGASSTAAKASTSSTRRPSGITDRAVALMRGSPRRTWTAGEVAEALKAEAASVSTLLAGAARDGKLRRVGRGAYQANRSR